MRYKMLVIVFLTILLAAVVLTLTVNLTVNANFSQISFLNSYIGMATLAWLVSLPAGFILWLGISLCSKSIKKNFSKPRHQKLLLTSTYSSLLFALAWVVASSYLITQDILPLELAVSKWLFTLVPIATLLFGASSLIVLSDSQSQSSELRQLIGGFLGSGAIILGLMMVLSYIFFFMSFLLS